MGTDVRNPGTLSMDEVQRYIGQLVLELEAARIRQSELEAAQTPTLIEEHANGS